LRALLQGLDARQTLLGRKRPVKAS
jgi:hypothetical protein